MSKWFKTSLGCYSSWSSFLWNSSAFLLRSYPHSYLKVYPTICPLSPLVERDCSKGRTYDAFSFRGLAIDIVLEGGRPSGLVDSAVLEKRPVLVFKWPSLKYACKGWPEPQCSCPSVPLHEKNTGLLHIWAPCTLWKCSQALEQHLWDWMKICTSWCRPVIWVHCFIPERLSHPPTPFSLVHVFPALEFYDF